MPLLIANAGGRVVYKERGGVIACVATMGVSKVAIIFSDEAKP